MTRPVWTPQRESMPRRFELVGDRMIWWAWADATWGGFPHWIDFAVYSTCRSQSSHLLRVDPFDADEPGCPDSWANAVPEMHGFVKWDGCMQWWTAEPAHIDSVDDLDELCATLRRVREVAIEITGDRE